jgi:predicted RNA-binding Zn-ribbon protein involved in translation (DUF1610 family)
MFAHIAMLRALHAGKPRPRLRRDSRRPRNTRPTARPRRARQGYGSALVQDRRRSRAGRAVHDRPELQSSACPTSVCEYRPEQVAKQSSADTSRTGCWGVSTLPRTLRVPVLSQGRLCPPWGLRLSFRWCLLGFRPNSGDWAMPITLFVDDSAEIVCPRCGMTTPKTIEWLRANDQYICSACNFEVNLNRDKQLAALDRSER